MSHATMRQVQLAGEACRSSTGRAAAPGAQPGWPELSCMQPSNAQQPGGSVQSSTASLTHCAGQPCTVCRLAAAADLADVAGTACMESWAVWMSASRSNSRAASSAMLLSSAQNSYVTGRVSVQLQTLPGTARPWKAGWLWSTGRCCLPAACLLNCAFVAPGSRTT